MTNKKSKTQFYRLRFKIVGRFSQRFTPPVISTGGPPQADRNGEICLHMGSASCLQPDVPASSRTKPSTFAALVSARLGVSGPRVGALVLDCARHDLPAMCIRYLQT